MPPDIDWSLLWGPALPESARSKSSHLLIVRDPASSPGMGLNVRTPWGDEVAASPTVTILEGERATPFNFLVGAQKATEILIDVPCLTAQGEEYLALSPGTDNRYVLSGSMLLRNPLAHGPVIALLNSCGDGTALYRHEPLSLAMAFRQAWRSPVLTVVRPIPEVEGRQFLGKVLERYAHSTSGGGPKRRADDLVEGEEPSMGQPHPPHRVKMSRGGSAFRRSEVIVHHCISWTRKIEEEFMTRRSSEKHTMKARVVRGRPSRSRLATAVLPLSVLRQVTGGEQDNHIQTTTPSPPPSTVG